MGVSKLAWVIACMAMWSFMTSAYSDTRQMWHTVVGTISHISDQAIFVTDTGFHVSDQIEITTQRGTPVSYQTLRVNQLITIHATVSDKIDRPLLARKIIVGTIGTH